MTAKTSLVPIDETFETLIPIRHRFPVGAVVVTPLGGIQFTITGVSYTYTFVYLLDSGGKGGWTTYPIRDADLKWRLAVTP